MEFEELIDKMIEEKMGCKEYKEIAESIDDEELSGMFMKMSEDEHNHYKMLKEYMKRKINNDNQE